MVLIPAKLLMLRLTVFLEKDILVSHFPHFPGLYLSLCLSLSHNSHQQILIALHPNLIAFVRQCVLRMEEFHIFILMKTNHSLLLPVVSFCLPPD
ncbi:hypothetical protein GKIL_1769 [Gloeobacter kilaueensis JS1]|uniref:Uncharacterized protein n=1 Tax=Gloeobacter kilaueensis (strain ATCC BAA-2537 / CCAP 1431/1 / ULC 316 / JS1) TaxID=1183438 RepID=U5QK17_GLOK1|nr:hypothetical protein GKIL_1769 [Gloeobacter kilaueensis JS1]